MKKIARVPQPYVLKLLEAAKALGKAAHFQEVELGEVLFATAMIAKNLGFSQDAQKLVAMGERIQGDSLDQSGLGHDDTRQMYAKRHLTSAVLSLLKKNAQFVQPLKEELARCAGQPEKVQYKGRPYNLLWSGKTKFGERARLQFLDGTKDFWVDARAIQRGIPQSSGYSGGGYSRSDKAPGGRRCPECGSRECAKAWNPRDLCDED